MKKSVLKLLAILGISAALFAFTNITGNAISGKISPAESAISVFAIQGSDTAKAEIESGTFQFKELKAGSYIILVKAKAPFKDANLENVKVSDTAATDVGEIALQQ